MTNKEKLKICNSNFCMICDITIECYNYEKFIKDQDISVEYLVINDMTYSKSYTENILWDILKEINE